MTKMIPYQTWGKMKEVILELLKEKKELTSDELFVLANDQEVRFSRADLNDALEQLVRYNYISAQTVTKYAIKGGGNAPDSV